MTGLFVWHYYGQHLWSSVSSRTAAQSSIHSPLFHQAVELVPSWEWIPAPLGMNMHFIQENDVLCWHPRACDHTNNGMRVTKATGRARWRNRPACVKLSPSIPGGAHFFFFLMRVFYPVGEALTRCHERTHAASALKGALCHIAARGHAFLGAELVGKVAALMFIIWPNQS